MGKIGDFFRKAADTQAEMTDLFNLGCEVLGTPAGGYWRCTTMERLDRVAAGRKEAARRAAAYPAPSRPNGYYSQDRGNGAIEQFIGRNGEITAERPHVHIIHNENEGRIVFVATQSDGSHSAPEYLPINASGNEVNAKVSSMRRLLR